MKRLRITVEDKSYDVVVELLDDDISPSSQKPAVATSSTRVSAPVAVPKPAATPKPAPASGGGGEVNSPLAAVVVSIDVAVGDTVTEGQKIFTLEAMKMNTLVSSPKAGTVSAINVAVGDSVEEGQSLIIIA